MKQEGGDSDADVAKFVLKQRIKTAVRIGILILFIVTILCVLLIPLNCSRFTNCDDIAGDNDHLSCLDNVMGNYTEVKKEPLPYNCTRVADYMPAVLAWAEENPWQGMAIIAGIYIPATILFIPGLILSLGAGFALGFPIGFVTIVIGANIGADLSFLIGRYLLRGWVEGMVYAKKKVVDKQTGQMIEVNKFPKFGAIDGAIKQQGFKIVLLLRLVPLIPFNVLNYALGITSQTVKATLLATLVGMLPGTALFVYLGTTMRSLADVASGNFQRGPEYWVLLGVGAASFVALVVLVTYYGRKALKSAGATDEAGDQANVVSVKTKTEEAGA